jgi:hypothetical protein
VPDAWNQPCRYNLLPVSETAAGAKAGAAKAAAAAATSASAPGGEGNNSGAKAAPLDLGPPAIGAPGTPSPLVPPPLGVVPMAPAPPESRTLVLTLPEPMYLGESSSATIEVRIHSSPAFFLSLQYNHEVQHTRTTQWQNRLPRIWD